MDLTNWYSRIPEVSGSYYKIHTGHPWWFRFAQINRTVDKVYLADFDHLYVDDVLPGRINRRALMRLPSSSTRKKKYPRSLDEPGERILDYELDADYLYAGNSPAVRCRPV